MSFDGAMRWKLKCCFELWVLPQILQIAVNQKTKQLPLDSPLTKLAFLPQSHPKYLWKRIGTEGGLPTFKVKRLDRGFQIRKAQISVNISG